MSEAPDEPSPLGPSGVDPVAGLLRRTAAFRVLVIALCALFLVSDVLLVSGLVQVQELSYSGGPCMWCLLALPAGASAAAFRIEGRTPSAWLAHVGAICCGCLLLCPALLGVPLLLSWTAPAARRAYGLGQ